MFNDNEPEGSEYIFGDLYASSRMTPHVPKAVYLKSHKQKKNWVLKNFQSNRGFFSIGTPVTAAVKDVPVFVPNFTQTEIPDDKPVHPKFGRNPDITYEEVPEKVASLNIENLVEISEERLSKVLTDSQSVSDDVAEILIQQGAVMMMSYDKATSYTEAVLRDGLGISVEIDSSVMVGVAQLTKLNVLNYYVNKMTSLPEDIKERFMRLITHKIACEAVEEMKKDVTSEKYSTVLRNLAARVKPTTDTDRPIGTLRTHQDVATKNEKDMSTDDIHAYNKRQAEGVRVSRR
jgi:hypothetical protein